MPSFQDSAVIFIIALLILGPKKLPELARQLGKIMGELRRASNEFKMQMEDELRLSEREEQRKRVESIVQATPEHALAAPLAETSAAPEHSGETTPEANPDAVQTDMHESASVATDALPTDAPAAVPQVGEHQAPVAIASAGELEMMPPPTGLPVGRGASPRSAEPQQEETAASHDESSQHA